MTVALTAAKAYAQVQSQFAKSLSEVAGPASGAAPAGGLDFGHMVTGAMNEIAQTGKMAERQMIAHANGKAGKLAPPSTLPAENASSTKETQPERRNRHGR